MSFESSQASASIITGVGAYGGAPLPHFVELRILNGLQTQISEVLLSKELRADNISQKPAKRGTDSYLQKVKDLEANRMNRLFELTGDRIQTLEKPKRGNSG
jgi:hypothetical protein